MLIANVACASVTVGTQKPHTSHSMPPDEIHGRGERQRRREVVLVEPRDLGHGAEITHDGIGRLDAVVPRVVQEPADVRVVEAADRGAVRIAVAVGEPVMVHVVARPPERPLLHRGRADEGQDEARGAIHLKRAVREIAVERERQADRAHEMRSGPQGSQRPRQRHEEREQRRRLHGPEHSDSGKREH